MSICYSAITIYQSRIILHINKCAVTVKLGHDNLGTVGATNFFYLFFVFVLDKIYFSIFSFLERIFMHPNKHSKFESKIENHSSITHFCYIII